MRQRVAIVGSGPTAIYALQELINCSSPLTVVMLESSDIAGKGTPYQRGINDPAMLSNIPSIEIPALPESLVDWLRRQPARYCDAFDIDRSDISDRAFYPRVVLGDYFRAQLQAIIAKDEAARHEIVIREGVKVLDIVPIGDRFAVRAAEPAGEDAFDHVIIATGHGFPSAPETAPGYFEAPWPATALRSIPPGRIGVLGTSLSAIDAVMTIATSFGRFVRTPGIGLEYLSDGNDFQVTMMSRKGLLPEADFFFPIPYEEPSICTAQAVSERIALGSSGLLDDIFDLFRRELAHADPDYAERIGLDGLTADTFAEAYFGVRDQFDPFEWAEANLAEAKRNYARRHKVAWRYAILICHEIIETAVTSFTSDDLARFNRSFKSIFADDYATVPHLSIERLLALHRADKLHIVALGDQAKVSGDGRERGATVSGAMGDLEFDTFVDATGQKSLSADEIPFPSLRQHGLVAPALTVTQRGSHRRTGGIDVDASYRPLIAGVRPVRRLYIPAVSYLLHKQPFVQGITSVAALGQVVARAIVADVMRPVRSRKSRAFKRSRPQQKSTSTRHDRASRPEDTSFLKIASPDPAPAVAKGEGGR